MTRRIVLSCLAFAALLGLTISACDLEANGIGTSPSSPEVSYVGASVARGLP